MVLKIRDGGSLQRKACYLALGVGMDGERGVLGMWFQENEGTKFGCKSSQSCVTAASQTS